MKKKSKVLIIALILLLAVISSVLIATRLFKNQDNKRNVFIESSDNYQDDKKYKTIGLLASNMQDRFIANVFSTIKEKSKENENIKILLYDSEGKKDKQYLQLEELIDLKVDGIILNPSSDIPLPPNILEKLKSSGIPIVAAGMNLAPYSYALCSIGFDSSSIGKSQADFIAGRLNGKGNILVFGAHQGLNSLSQQRLTGFDSAMSKYPGIHVIKIEYGSWDNSDKLEQIRDIVKNFKSIDGIAFEHNDAISEIFSCFDQLNIKPVTIAADYSPEILKYIKNGKLEAAVYMNSSDMAVNAFDTIMKALKREKVQSSKSVPFDLITGENIDTHIEKILNYIVK